MESRRTASARWTLEEAATSAPGVAEAAVVGVHDPVRGTMSIASVTLRPGVERDIVRADVSSAEERAISGVARLSQVYVVTALPKTRAGKVMRRLLREAAETSEVRGDLTGLDDPAALGSVLEAV